MPPLTEFRFIFEAGFLTVCGPHQFGQPGLPASARNSPCHCLSATPVLVWDYKCVSTPFFNVDAGDPTSALHTSVARTSATEPSLPPPYLPLIPSPISHLICRCFSKDLVSHQSFSETSREDFFTIPCLCSNVKLPLGTSANTAGHS